MHFGWLRSTFRALSHVNLAMALALASGFTLASCMLLGHPERRALPPLELPFLQPSPRGELHVVLLALDGVRYREIFDGTDLVLVRSQRLPAEQHQTARELMPNLHALIDGQGAALGSASMLSASGPNFVSLPGYTEMLTGRRVTACRDNYCTRGGAPTILDGCAALSDVTIEDCAAVTSWPNISRVVAERSERVAVSTGRHGGVTRSLVSAASRGALLQAERSSPFPGHGDFRADTHTARIALSYFDQHQPRVMFIGLGEPDEYAHRNDYSNYLGALRAADRLIGEISTRLDRLAAKGERTAFFVTTDHGRADGFVSHGGAFAESARIWLVASGTEIHGRGRLRAASPRFLADVAPTIRRLADMPEDRHQHAGSALDELLRPAPASGFEAPVQSDQELGQRPGRHHTGSDAQHGG
jgi:hypothetical protein